MSVYRKTSILYLLAVFFLMTTTGAVGTERNPSVPLLPDDLVIEDGYKPGIGLPVGKILLVQGRVVIMHATESKGFYAKNNHMLYKGDTIVTLDRGRVRLKLNDDSIITLASGTKLVINQSVYNTGNKTRSSFIGMDKGKARFLIKKLVDFKHSEFKVKTKTAVAGVRGSEFIIRATDLLTEIFTLADTKLEVVSLAMPCPDFKGYPPPPECEVKPIFLTDFQKTIVRIDELPTEVEIVAPLELDEFDNDFTVTPDLAGPEGISDIQPAAQPGGAPASAPAGPVSVLVAPDLLIEPDEPPAAAAIQPEPSVDIEPLVNPSEDIIEDEMKGELADFPSPPED